MRKIIHSISDGIIAFIIGIFGEGMGRVIGTFIVSMLPIVELRGSIPIGYSLGLPWYTNMAVSILGNMLPVPFILLFIVKVFEFMKKHNIMTGLVEKLEKRALNRSEKVARSEFLGLMLFVAVPFPGTGAWTGALIAALLQLNRKKSFITIFLGVLIAATIVTLGIYGLLDKII